MNTETLFKTLAVIAIALASFSLKWQWDAHAQMAVTREKLKRILSDTSVDIDQNECLAKHWRIHGWTRDKINELRTLHSLSLESWPPLD